MPTDPPPDIDPIVLRQSIEACISLCGANYHIVRTRHGLDDILDAIFDPQNPPDACIVGRRILSELTTNESGQWSAYASEIFVGVTQFMVESGFNKPVKERLVEFKAILGEDKPDIEKIGDWFDKVYTRQTRRHN